MVAGGGEGGHGARHGPVGGLHGAGGGGGGVDRHVKPSSKVKLPPWDPGSGRRKCLLACREMSRIIDELLGWFFLVIFWR